jgi:hypothetical protein
MLELGSRMLRERAHAKNGLFRFGVGRTRGGLRRGNDLNLEGIQSWSQLFLISGLYQFKHSSIL